MKEWFNDSKKYFKESICIFSFISKFFNFKFKDTFANVVSEQNEIASKLVKNVKEVGNDRYYKGDFYSDVGTYPEGMFLVVEKLIENYIAFAHMGEASYLAPIGQRFEEKIEGQVVKRYIAVSQKKKQGYYCIDIYDDSSSEPKATLTARLNITKNKNGYFITPKDDLKIQYKGKTYKNQDALNFLGF